MNNTCRLCHIDPAVSLGGLCDECDQARDYYEHLSPEERAAEDAAIADYVRESSFWEAT